MKAVNLLPSDQRSSSKATPAAKGPASSGGSLGAVLVLGVLAFAVVASAAYVLTTNTIKDRKAQLARVQAEAQAVQLQAAALQPFAEFQTMAANRLATVQALATSRFDWDRALADISKRIPRDVRLKSIKGSTDTQTQGGSSLRGAIQAPAIELAGCTRSQSAVARLMSRMRSVRGVTRVALAKSDKDGSGGIAAPTSAVSGLTGESLCPKGAPPAFEIVVFFERAALPANGRANPAAGAGADASTTTAQPQAGAEAGAQAAQPSAPSASGTTETVQGAQPATQGVSSK